MQWDAGKFVTPMGAEVIESQDNWNYSRSILFGYAIPFYHLGVRATLPVTDKISLAAQLVNGWNNATRAERRQDRAPDADAQADVGHHLDRELHGRQGGGRRSTPATSSTPRSPSASTSKLSVMANFDYGKEGGVSGGGSRPTLKYQATPTWALVGRYEYVDDTDGGFMTIGTKAQSFTLTSDHTIAGSFKARLEYRLDKTDGDYFSKDDGSPTDTQQALTVGLVYTFAGKI